MSEQLEFRVYRVNDPIKFFSQLQELHSFGGRGPALPKHPRTWLEKFHAWKHSLWAWIRDFVRAQFSPDERHKIRLWRLGENEPKKKGPQRRELRAGAGAQPAAGGLGLEVDGTLASAVGEPERSPFPSATRASTWWRPPTARCAPTPSSSSPRLPSSPRLRPDAWSAMWSTARAAILCPTRRLRVWIDQEEVASGKTDAQGHARHQDHRREAGERGRAGDAWRSVRHQHSRRVEPGQRS